MFDAIKRIFGGNDPHRPDWRALAAWAQAEGYELKRVRESDGLVVEGSYRGERPWRLEWGASQRAYIESREIRLRVDAELPVELQMLVLSRALAEKLERETFEQFTQTTQTYVDTSAPEEMRWLAMFPRAALNGPKSLRGRFSAVGMEPAAVSAWVADALAERLGDPASALLGGDPALVLMTLRGRLYLRVAVDRPEAVLLAEALALGDAALEQASRIARFRLDTGEWPSAGPVPAGSSVSPSQP